ncbi:hypothetical protein FQA39_LY07314 [Lamprigera yunnana]|nr:hypothetical protein FQA39_LY07314 [Lamprigera yunnana]
MLQDDQETETFGTTQGGNLNPSLLIVFMGEIIRNDDKQQGKKIGDNAIPAFRFYRSAQPRFPLEALSETASALNADNSDIEDDVAETTSADIGDCDLWVPEDEEEDEENEEEDEENVENKISDSEIEASGNSRRTDKAISNLKCKKNTPDKKGGLTKRNKSVWKSRHLVPQNTAFQRPLTSGDDAIVSITHIFRAC